MSSFISYNSFLNADFAWKNSARALLNDGDRVPSRAGATREIVGWKYSIRNPYYCWAGGSRSGNASLGYAYAELLWYLSLRRDIKMLGTYAPSYSRFCNDGVALGAYGYRWKNNPGVIDEKISTLHAAMLLLQKKPDDRRAVVSMWDSSDIFLALDGTAKDIPCTLNMQFLIRNDRLHSNVNMRSNDLFLGGIYDPFCFSQIQIIMAGSLGVRLGAYHHSVGSFHCYEKDVARVVNSISGNDQGLWKSPEILQIEARQLVENYEGSPLARVELLMRNDFYVNDLGAVSAYVNEIPSEYKWSETAVRAMHFHLNKGANK